MVQSTPKINDTSILSDDLPINTLSATSRFSWLKPVVLLGILPNTATILLIKCGYNFAHPHINVDYFYWGATSVFFPRWITIAGVLSLMLTEIALLLSQITHYPIAQAINWCSQGHEALAENHYRLITICFLIYITIFTNIVLFLPQIKKKKETAIAFLFIALFLTGQRLIQRQFMVDEISAVQRLVSSASYRLLLEIKPLLDLKSLKNQIIFNNLPDASAASNIFLKTTKENTTKLKNKNTVLILVESLGDIKNHDIRNQIFSSLRGDTILARYDVNQGSVPFHGATQNGEMRELCNIFLQSYGRRNIPDCLPQYFKKYGYETFSYHGYMRYFYDRDYWYPQIGFEHSYFIDELEKIGLPLCKGEFLGICDTAIASHIEKQLIENKEQKPLFIYWMTLNSHVSPDHQLAEQSQLNCALHPSLQDRGLCDYSRIIHNTLNAIAKIATNPKLPPTQFIIVGDHAPGFLRAFRRAEFSEETVPYWILDPK